MLIQKLVINYRLIMQENTIICPKCSHPININQVLNDDLERKIRQEYALKQSALEAKLEQDKEEFFKKQSLLEAKLQSEKESLLKKETEFSTLLAQKLEDQLRLEKQALEHSLKQSLKSQLEQENKSRYEAMQAELQQKNLEVLALKEAQIQIEQLKREKDSLSATITLAKEQELTEQLRLEREKIKEQVMNEQQFKLREKEKIIDDLKHQMESMHRKTESFSSELAGEVQEQALFNLLSYRFPLDEIQDIAKGQKGADIIQTVRSPLGIYCGKIYYESKRTKHYQAAWLQKLKADNLEQKADILILVTDAMPNDSLKPCLEQGVWICRFSDVEWLSLVLRESLLKLHNAVVKETGRETKMSLLYNYLTSEEFKNQFEAMFEGFSGLMALHNSEKLRMQKVWKEREKQLERVLLNATNFYGSLKGIAGSQIPNVALLEDDSEEGEQNTIFLLD